MNPFSHTGLSISDSLKSVRKSVLIYETIISDSEHRRQTDSSATYKIHARAIQQPPSEGMAKLTSLFAQAMEPIAVDGSK